MGQSLSQMYIHLTFGTKGRYPFIKPAVRETLHAYLAGTLKQLDSPALIINSVSDHIHILFRLSKNYSLAKITEELKKQSSKWMKENKDGHPKFFWQSGYGAFSVSGSKIETVKQYIQNQEEHHKQRTYQEEVELFIAKYGIVHYDAHYFWT